MSKSIKSYKTHKISNSSRKRDANLLPYKFYEQVVFQDSGCWEWVANKRHGYGRFLDRSNKVHTAHRYSYETLVGPVPVGLDLDHLCRNRACVNPEHLEPVTRSVNLLRGDTIPARHAARTHCNAGHEFTRANTHIRTDGGRRCLTCEQIRRRCA